MMAEEINRKIKSRKKIIKGLRALFIGLGIGGAGWIINFTNSIYESFLKQPNIECFADENKNSYLVEGDFRGFTLKLHPQLVIQFDKYIVLLIHLESYYEEEFLCFEKDEKGRRGQVDIQHLEYVNELQTYIKSEVIKKVCSKNNQISEKKMDRRLKIYVSTMGGVRYMLLNSNEEKTFCIIEIAGIVKDYDDHSEEILSRLYETQLTLKDDLSAIKADEEIGDIIEEVVKKIVPLY